MANENPNLESCESQKKQILAYLMDGKQLTNLDALYLFGSWRCQARISDLRKEGWNIKTEMITTNTGKRVARYTMGTPCNINY